MWSRECQGGGWTQRSASRHTPGLSPAPRGESELVLFAGGIGTAERPENVVLVDGAPAAVGADAGGSTGSQDPNGRLPMEGVMQPLREEHAELAPEIERLRVLADGLTSSSATLTIKPRIEEALEFLRGHLVPHAMAEEAVLYPAVEEAMGAPGATATMSRDHVEVVALTDALAGLRSAIRAYGPSTAQILEARRLLYGLYALVGVHLAKEEEIYVPILEARLDATRAADLYRRMEEAAARAREPEDEPQVVAAG